MGGNLCSTNRSKPSRPTSKLAQQIHIKMTTWQKPSFGVFDFGPTNHQVSVTHYIASKNGTFLLDFKKDQIFEVRGYSPLMDASGHKLFRLDADERRLTDLDDSRKLSESLWVPLTLESPHYLAVGDTIRFGKQQMVVSSVSLNPKAPVRPLLKSDNILDHKVARVQNTSFESTSTCRICLEPNARDNPFVDICLCSRQMPMHLNCVREWMKRKCETTTSKRVVFFNLSEVECEVCKTEYPGSVVLNGQVHLLFEPTVEPGRRHLVMNILDKKTLEVKGYSILYFDSPTERFTIGRTEENDLSFNELSISRVHAELTLGKEGILVSDLKSKYGTMLKVKNFELKGRNGVCQVQIDKFLFEFHTFIGDSCFCPIPVSAVRQVEPFQGALPLKKVMGPSKSERVLKIGADLPNRPSGSRTLLSNQILDVQQRAGSAMNFKKVRQIEEVIADEPERLQTEENLRPSLVVFSTKPLPPPPELKPSNSLVFLEILQNAEKQPSANSGTRPSNLQGTSRLQTDAGFVRQRSIRQDPVLPTPFVHPLARSGASGFHYPRSPNDSLLSLEVTPNTSFRFN
jgi:pSer/pThr/pTyr-binding forkhead associated (FHA) protein